MLNRGLDLAEGEWLTFLDHDDVLEPDALFQNVRLIQENPGLDLIYSDEDKLTEAGFDSPILKPDWSPDFFLSCNYLCHLIFLRRDLVRAVGGFRREFDGSQDYDLLLRITEPSLYGATKLAWEILVPEHGEAFGLCASINRCGMLAGAGQFA